MRFSPDGERLVVSDRGSGGWLWIFERRKPDPNHTPTARVVTDPPNRALVLRDGEARITLDGSQSDDGDAGEQHLEFRWAKVSGPEGDTIESPRESVTVVRLGEPGRYVYALTVNDGQSNNQTHLAQIPIEVLSVSVQLGDASPFRRHSHVPFLGRPADVTCDPTDDHVFYAIDDDSVRLGGGIYRVVRRGPIFHKEARVVSEGNLSSLIITPDGHLWFVQKLGSRNRAHVMVARDLRGKPPYAVEPVIWNFAGPTDDDPFVLGLVPSSFQGQGLSPGDIVLGDTSLDSSRQSALFTFSPSRPVLRPDAHDGFLISPNGFEDHGVTTLVDFDFDSHRQLVYALFVEGKILAIDPAGEVVGTTNLLGFVFVRPRWRGLEVDPGDGRVWILEGRTNRVFSFQPGPELDPRMEITFKRDDGRGTVFRRPNLRFSPDGRRLVVTQQDKEGWLWVFERE